jgi:hypothetical protein
MGDELQEPANELNWDDPDSVRAHFKALGWSAEQVEDLFRPLKPEDSMVSMPLADGTQAMIRGDGAIGIEFPALPGPWAYNVQIEVVDGKPGIVSLAIWHKENTPPTSRTVITARGLRRVPVSRFLQGAREAQQWKPEDWAKHAAKVAPPPGSKTWPPEHYIQVAQVSWQAEFEGRPPREAIAEHWNVSKPTASRWRRRARELGYLDPYQPPNPPEPVEHPVYHHVALTRKLELQLFHKVLNNLDDYPGAVRWQLEAEVFGRVLYQLAENPEHPLHGQLHEQAQALARALREHFTDDPE